MMLALFGFLKLPVQDVFDILVVAVIIFLLFTWLRGSTAWSIFLAIAILYVIRFVASFLGMKLTASIMDKVLSVGVIALIVIFQPEIRRFLAGFGGRTISNMRKSSFFSSFFNKMRRSKADSGAVNEVTEACRRMSEERTGALIVLQHQAPLDDVIATGDRIDSVIHRRLIMNIFFKNSPLHDGAMVIADNRIVAVRCTLPITERTNIPPTFGMRHKAAIGIADESDADVVVVSEETGEISFIRSSGVTKIGNINELKLLLSGSMV